MRVLLLSLMVVGACLAQGEDSVLDFFNKAEEPQQHSFGSMRNNNPMMPSNPVTVMVQPLSYTNTLGYIPSPTSNQTFTCYPLQYGTCNFLFSFSLDGWPVKSYMTTTATKPTNYTVNLSNISPFTAPITLTYQQRPWGGALIVFHNGAVYGVNTSRSADTPGYYEADVFPVDFSAVLPANANSAGAATYYTMTSTSYNSNSNFTFRVAMRCANQGQFGPACALSKCSPIGNTMGSCQDASGNKYSCMASSTVSNQYYNCTKCPNGVMQSGGCTPTTAPPPPTAGTVTVPGPTIIVTKTTGGNFKGATIALAIILAIVLIIAVGFFVRSYMKNKKDDDDFHEKRNQWGARNEHSGTGSSASSTTGTGSSTSGSRSSSTASSAQSTPKSGTHGFKAIPDTPDRDHLAVKTFPDTASSRSTSRRSSQASHASQGDFSSLPDGGRTTPRLEAKV